MSASAPPGAPGGADLGGRIEVAAQAGALRGVPGGPVRVRALGHGESYSAWLVRSGDRARVVRVQRRAAAQMPRPISEEFAVMRHVPPQLGTRALAMDADPGNPLGAPYMVTSYVPGRVLRPRDWGPPLFAALARQIARLHLALAESAGKSAGGSAGEMRGAGDAAPSSDTLPGGAAATVAPASAQGEEVLAWWRGSAPWTLEHPLVAPLLGAWRRELDRLDGAFEAVPTHPLIHGDLVVTNVVVPDGGLPRLIDFEWAAPGDVAKDLALIGGSVTGGPWYAPMGSGEIGVLVGEYVRVMAAQAPTERRVPGVGAGRWGPEHASVADHSCLLPRRDAYELIDRMGNLLYCLSRSGAPREGDAHGTGGPDGSPRQGAAHAGAGPEEAVRDGAARYALWAAQIATGMAGALAQSRRH